MNPPLTPFSPAPVTSWRRWIVPRRDWDGPNALVPLETCYRLFELYSWSFGIMSVVAIVALARQAGGAITESLAFRTVLAALGFQILALVFRGLPFLVRYAVFFAAITVMTAASSATLGITPAWAFLIILVLSSAGLLFGLRAALALSAALLLLHVVIAWGWITGRLPIGASPAAYRVYTDFTLTSVWVRMLSVCVVMLVPLQLVMRYVLGDMNRGLESANTALEQLRSEKRLREHSEEKFAAIFNLSPDICGIVRVRDSRILDVNQAFVAQTGWSREEALRHTTRELGIWPEGEERARAVNLALQAGELTSHEINWQTRPGERRVGLISMRLMELEGEKVFNVVIRDITERRRREQAVQSFSELTGGETGRAFFAASLRFLATELSVRYAFIVETTPGPDGAAIGQTLAAWADGPAADFTYSLAGTPCGNVLEQGLCHYPDHVAELFPTDAILTRMRARSYAGLPIRDTQGRARGLVVVLDDKPMPDAGAASVLLVLVATRAAAEMQRMQSEYQVSRLNAELESRVRDRTVELAARVGEVERLNAELQHLMRDLRASQQSADRSAARFQETNANLLAANQELEAFSYSVSHDLRAPLRNMTGFLELLKGRTAGRVDAETERFLGVLNTEAVRMGHLIDDLLTFSRIGRAEMRPQTVRLQQLIDATRETLQSDSRDRTIEWVVGPLPNVHGDPALLAQVMTNLLSNAVKFTRRSPAARIEIGSNPPIRGDRLVTVYVRDNGVGFNPKYLDRLFGVFQRLHNSRDFEGTGIGLANVKRIVNRHGGRIWAEGQVNGGATFYFTIAAADE